MTERERLIDIIGELPFSDEYHSYNSWEWAEHFAEPLRTGRVPGETLDFYIICPLAEKAEENEWQKSRLEDIKKYILEQM